MKKILKYSLLPLFAVLFCITGCYKDKGNYDYNELTSLVIDTTGGAIKPEMLVKQFSRLVLKPNVKYEGNPENLEYKWELYAILPERLPNNMYPTAKVISDKRDLDVEMSMVADKYYLTYSVTDKTIGVKKFLTIKVEVASSFNKGWLVLEESEGSYDLGFVKSTFITPAIDPADEGGVFDIYSSTNGSKLANAKGIYQYYTPYDNKVYVYTDNDGVRMNGITLKNEANYSQIFYIPESVQKPQKFGASWNSTMFLINDGGVQSGGYSFKYSGRLRGDYSAAPYLLPRKMIPPNFPPVMVIYDTRNKRFMQLALFTYEFGSYGTPPVGAPFDMNNIGLDLMYMDNGNNDNTYCIFKDPNTAKYYLYVADLNTDVQAPLRKLEMNACPEIAQATQYAFGSRGEVAYYAVNNKVYYYNYNGTNTATVSYTFDAAEKITNMKIFKETGHVNDSKLLIVSTYNETTKAGKVTIFQANELTGTLNTASKKEYTGFGRIIDMCNKQ